MAHRIKWQGVVLFGTRSGRVREALGALTVDPRSLLHDGPEDAGQCSGGVVPPQSDVWLVVQLETDVAITVAALRNTADRLEKDLAALRSQVFPEPLAQEISA